MERVKVNIQERESGYPIIIGDGVIEQTARLLGEKYQGDKILLVSDENVFSLYGDKVKSLLENSGFKVICYKLPPGEKAKRIHNLQEGYNILIENNFNRDNLIIALGGGVVGDLAGFLAATYMRGIFYVQMPTSLLAQVDSSVGGKTAVNHPGGKNLIGAFYQPLLVLIDPGFLETLPERELKTGLAEVIKHGLISDSNFAHYLREHRDDIFNLETDILTYIINKSCSIKAQIVSQDEKEEGIRALLNYGHTIGHALEAAAGYGKYTHGEAVAVGMIGAGRLACELGYLNSESVNYIEELIIAYELPGSFQYKEDIEEVYQALFRDKKVKDNRLRWILLEGIGEAHIKQGLDSEIILKVMEGLR